jgi:uncharacterized lipoprotein YajG
MRQANVLIAFASVALLAACGEKPQTLGGNRSDVAPFQGATNSYVVPGWKAGDKVSWEQALKARAQYTQNEYTRTTPPNK